MNIDDLTLGELKTIQGLLGNAKQNNDNPYKIGEKYLIRTVTLYYVGILVEVYEKELVLKDVAWIPDTGRFADCLKSGNANEIEPYQDGNVIIGRGAIVDASIWEHSVLRKQK